MYAECVNKDQVTTFIYTRTARNTKLSSYATLKYSLSDGFWVSAISFDKYLRLIIITYFDLIWSDLFYETNFVDIWSEDKAN